MKRYLPPRYRCTLWNLFVHFIILGEEFDRVLLSGNSIVADIGRLEWYQCQHRVGLHLVDLKYQSIRPVLFLQFLIFEWRVGDQFRITRNIGGEESILRYFLLVGIDEIENIVTFVGLKCHNDVRRLWWRIRWQEGSCLVAEESIDEGRVRTTIVGNPNGWNLDAFGARYCLRDLFFLA